MIDTGVPQADAGLPLDGTDALFGPTSTPVAVVVAHSIVARTAEVLLGRGYEPKVMLSPNVTDYQAANANNDEVYEDLWRRLSASMTDRLLFIGGEWTAGPATVEVTNPATGSPVGTTSVADRAAVEAAVTAARRGQDEWWRLGPARAASGPPRRGGPHRRRRRGDRLAAHA